MTGTPRAFATLDLGAATTATALVARVDRRWRLLGSLSAPAAVPADLLLDVLLARVRAADRALADDIELPAHASADLPRLIARSAAPATMAVLAGSERVLATVTSAVARSGWRSLPASVERHDPRAITALILGRAVDAVLVAAGEPPGSDERGALAELGALVAAAAGRRPELTIILAGAMAQARAAFAAPDGESAGDRILVAPAADAGDPAGSRLVEVLAGLRRVESDSRMAIGRSAAGLAGALDRRVELLEIGFDGGLRASGIPGATAGAGSGRWIATADAALVPPELDDQTLERILGWSTLALDRHRLRDRLLELRAGPWSGVAGDGGPLRLAAARAALARLVELTPELSDGPPPDLLVIAGGAFAAAPGAATMLAVADVVRRPGAVHLAYDHARLLGPIGTIEDPVERDRLIADLAGDLLIPLGAVIMPANLRAGRRGGRVVVQGPAGSTEMGLEPGALELVVLPPGRTASVQLDAREPFLMGTRGRRVTVEVAGGLAGVLIDLRDVPLRLPDRREHRRDLLARWQDAAWPGADE